MATVLCHINNQSASIVITLLHFALVSFDGDGMDDTDTRNAPRCADDAARTLSEHPSAHQDRQGSPAQASPSVVPKICATTPVVCDHIEASTTPDPPSLKTTSATSTTHWFWRSLVECGDRWVLESLSCGMAVACLIAVIAILAVYQDKPLPTVPDAISINSWVSIFTAVMKAAVMLPVAECG